MCEAPPCCELQEGRIKSPRSHNYVNVILFGLAFISPPDYSYRCFP